MTAWIRTEVDGFPENIGPFPSAAHAREFADRLRLDGDVIEEANPDGIHWTLAETEAFLRAVR